MATSARTGRLVLALVAGVVVVCAALVISALVLFPDRLPGTEASGRPLAASGAPSADPALATKPVVDGTGARPTALTVVILVKGSGPPVRVGQQVTVNYVGVSMTTGAEFDSSWSRREPATFLIGVGQLITGWDRGLPGVPVGSRVRLDIPADLAYGDASAGGQPSGPLRFVVDILAAN